MTIEYTNRWTPPTGTMPGNGFTAITPSNTVDDAAGPFRAVYIGVAGDIAIVGLNNVAVVFKNAVAGSILPVMGRRVNVTGTGGSDYVGIR